MHVTKYNVLKVYNIRIYCNNSIAKCVDLCFFSKYSMKKKEAHTYRTCSDCHLRLVPYSVPAC